MEERSPGHGIRQASGRRATLYEDRFMKCSSMSVLLLRSLEIFSLTSPFTIVYKHMLILFPILRFNLKMTVGRSKRCSFLTFTFIVKKSYTTDILRMTDEAQPTCPFLVKKSYDR